jgi:hypothetical protein
VSDAVIHGLQKQIEGLFKDADELYRHLRVSAYARDMAIQAEFAQYLCVRTSGLVDASVSHILSKHIDHPANRSTVRRFAQIRLGRISNLNSERLCKLLSEFDVHWKEMLESFLDSRRKDALDSLVANRNNIAHGRPTTVTVSRVTEFYKRAVEIIDYVDTLVPR